MYCVLGAGEISHAPSEPRRMWIKVSFVLFVLTVSQRDCNYWISLICCTYARRLRIGRGKVVLTDQVVFVFEFFENLLKKSSWAKRVQRIWFCPMNNERQFCLRVAQPTSSLPLNSKPQEVKNTRTVQTLIPTSSLSFLVVKTPMTLLNVSRECNNEFVTYRVAWSSNCKLHFAQ